MSGAISSRSSLQLEGLLRHVKENNDSALVIKGDGSFFNSTPMSYSSAMWRMVGFQKPAEDIPRNQDSLRTLVVMIAGANVKNAGISDDQKTAAGRNLALQAQILDSPTKLPGDSRTYTVRERIARGTYVSSALVKQIASNATRIARGMNEAERAATNLRLQNVKIFQPVNALQVSRFFGRELPDSGSILANLVDFVKTAPARLLAQITNSPQISPYRAMILELQQKGTPDFPASRKEFWQVFADEMLKHDGAGAPQGKFFESLERTLSAKATNAAAKGRILDEDDIRKAVTEFVTDRLRLGQFVELLNDKKIRNLGQPEISDAIRAWKDTVAPIDSQGIDQADCDWLAHELEVAVDAKRYMEQPGSGLRDGFRDFIMGKDDALNPFSLLGDLIDNVQKNHAKHAPSPNMTMEGRWFHYKAKNQGNFEIDPAAGLNEMKSPREYTSKNIAMMMGDARIKPLLLEHHERMEEQNAAELNLVGESQRKVKDALQPFRILKGQFKSLARRHDMTIEANKPETAAAFVRGQIGPLIEAARMERAASSPAMLALEAKLPTRPLADASPAEAAKYGAAVRHYSEELLKTAKMQLGAGAEEQILDEILPVLDRYTEFHKEVAALPRTSDGRISAPSEKLKQLDAEAQDLMRAADELFDHVHRLELKFSGDGSTAKVQRNLTANNQSESDPLRRILPGLPKTGAQIHLKGFTYGLREATKDIFLGTRAYQRASGADERQMAELAGTMKETMASLQADLGAPAKPQSTNPFEDYGVDSKSPAATGTTKPQSTNPFEDYGADSKSPVATGTTKPQSTNPFEDYGVDSKSPAATGTTKPQSTNPFEDYGVDSKSPAATGTTKPQSTNPFEDYGVDSKSPAATGTTKPQSTNPFEDYGVDSKSPGATGTTKPLSTNPFDDYVVDSTSSAATGTTNPPSTNPFDDNFVDPKSPAATQPTGTGTSGPNASARPKGSTNPFDV